MTPNDFFTAHGAQVIAAQLMRVRGSCPREAGAEMLIGGDAIWGSVGGGRLEQIVIDTAREMLASGAETRDLDVPLGPEISQCCGGRVEVALTRPDAAQRAAFAARHTAETAAQPHVYVFGAGHVGRALANLLQFMPVQTTLVDERADQQALCTADVARATTPLPEEMVRKAPPGSVAIVLTHSHATDYLIAAEALAAGHFAYVGMIGSKTKRAKFHSWCAETAQACDPDDLICPIGAKPSGDKRPPVIASFVVAEVMACLSAQATKTAIAAQ